ncbi:ABC transporter permease [Pectinatus haikarae]|uniref:ABC transporter permease n=1 Tax=Pectinatus haikarae TaxID=349096 RepID=UPI0018C475AE|nr:ABC transporter permease [Pectinatus haikarae]
MQVVAYLKKGYKYKWLLYELVNRDLKIKYRRSILGYLWSLLNPLLMMAILTIVFSSFFRFDIPNYPVYLLCGQLIYGFFSESSNIAMNSVINNSSLIKKVYMPKYIFPVATIVSAFVNYFFSLLALMIVMLVTKVKLTMALFLVPLPLLYILFFSLGIGMLLSTLAVFFRDIVHLYGVLLTGWMYLTPIFYPMSMVPEFVRKIIYLNPLYYFIEIFREIVLYGRIPSLSLHIICIVLMCCSLFLGLYVFKKNQDRFILYF